MYFVFWEHKRSRFGFTTLLAQWLQTSGEETKSFFLNPSQKVWTWRSVESWSKHLTPQTQRPTLASQPNWSRNERACVFFNYHESKIITTTAEPQAVGSTIALANLELLGCTILRLHLFCSFKSQDLIYCFSACNNLKSNLVYFFDIKLFRVQF